jgi:hypothetical protein
MMVALDRAIESNVELLNSLQLSKILWANAKLNHQTHYNRRLADKFMASITNGGVSELSIQGTRNLTKVLWSMAVLRILTLEV